MQTDNHKTEGVAPVGSSAVLGRCSVETLGAEPSGYTGFEMRDVRLTIGDTVLRGKIRCANDATPLDAEWAVRAIKCALKNSGWLDEEIMAANLPNDPKLSHDDREPANERKQMNNKLNHKTNPKGSHRWLQRGVRRMAHVTINQLPPNMLCLLAWSNSYGLRQTW
jgi:hypothetical protein